MIRADLEEIYCFGGNPLDRVSERRDDREWIATLLRDPQTRLQGVAAVAHRDRPHICRRWANGLDGV